jgi:uncharacterized protein YkwD
VRAGNRARLAAAALLVATITAACYGGGGRQVPLAAAGPGQELYDLVNQSRAQAGLPPLAWNDQLGGLAQDWSDQIAANGGFRHRDLNAVLQDPAFGGFWALGENLLHGPCGMTAQEIHNAFMASPPHSAIMLSPDYNVIGIGVACGFWAEVYVTENFGRV